MRRKEKEGKNVSLVVEGFNPATLVFKY